MTRLTGKRAIITGGAQGQGAAVARHIVREGATLRALVIAVSEADGDDLRRILRDGRRDDDGLRHGRLRQPDGGGLNHGHNRSLRRGDGNLRHLNGGRDRRHGHRRLEIIAVGRNIRRIGIDLLIVLRVCACGEKGERSHDRRRGEKHFHRKLLLS